MFLMISMFLLKMFFSACNKPPTMFFMSLPLFITSIFSSPTYDLHYHSSSLASLDNINTPIILMTILLMLALEVGFMHSLYSNFLFLCAFMTFTCSKVITFYVAFELNLIPIFLIVLGWGYQPERIFANKMMILYTLAGSLPLLLIIVFFPYLTQFSMPFVSASNSPPFSVFFMMTLAFLVKLPIFSLHLWLPLAHVEAPLMGSMILAGILLKLGGYGLIRFVIMNSSLLSNFTKLMMVFSAVGAALALTFCVTQVDMKVIIAYSSVGHMSVASASVFSLSSVGVSSAMINFVAHGFTSSMMFLLAGLIYTFSGTRHILMNKGTITIAPMVMTAWFLACLLNAGGPPTMNLLAEILSTISIINLSPILVVPLASTLLLGMLFNMKMFSLTTQGTFKENATPLKPFNFSFMASGVFHLLASTLLIFALSMMMV